MKIHVDLLLPDIFNGLKINLKLWKIIFIITIVIWPWKITRSWVIRNVWYVELRPVTQSSPSAPTRHWPPGTGPQCLVADTAFPVSLKGVQHSEETEGSYFCIKNLLWRDPDLRWQGRKILSSHPPMDTPKLRLLTKQLSPRTTWSLAEQIF